MYGEAEGKNIFVIIINYFFTDTKKSDGTIDNPNDHCAPAASQKKEVNSCIKKHKVAVGVATTLIFIVILAVLATFFIVRGKGHHLNNGRGGPAKYAKE